MCGPVDRTVQLVLSIIFIFEIFFVFHSIPTNVVSRSSRWKLVTESMRTFRYVHRMCVHATLFIRFVFKFKSYFCVPFVNSRIRFHGVIEFVTESFHRAKQTVYLSPEANLYRVCIRPLRDCLPSIVFSSRVNIDLTSGIDQKGGFLRARINFWFKFTK